MATAEFTSIGPDWYNIYRQDDGSLRLEETPVIATYDQTRVADDFGLRTKTVYRAGYVSFTDNGNWIFAAEREGYVGTFNLPDLARMRPESLHQLIDPKSATWVVPPLEEK